MKKLLSPVLGVLVISALAVSCDNSAPAGPDDAVTPQFAVVDQDNENSKRFYAYGYARDYYYPYNYRSYDVAVYDIKTSSGKSKWLRVYNYGYYPYFHCRDEVELKNKEFAWSMGKAWVKVETDCGLVDLTLERTSEVFKGHYDYWYGATENCSPPEGQFSWHVVSNGQSAQAAASGTAGMITIPVSGDYYQYNYARINHGTYHRTTCGSN